jgi:CoA:oxalate CoA-transferase
MGGVMSLTGHPGGPPTRVGTSIGDIVAGIFTAIGVNAALYRRTISGEGCKIDVAMLDCQLAILENAMARYFATGEVPGPLGARHATIAPFQCFTTRDGYIIIAAGNDALFAKLCAALGAPELAADARFATNPARIGNLAALIEAIEQRLMGASTRDWIARLEAAGVPCGPLNNVAQALAEPQVGARTMVVHTHDPVAGMVQMAGNPIKLSGYPDPIERPHAPDLDEQRAAILRELGG